MGMPVDLWDKLKRHFAFTPDEIKGLAIAVLATAFIISFNDWGKGSEANIPLGFLNFLSAVLVVAVSFFIHISVQRIWSLGTGYRLGWFRYGINWWALGLIAVMGTFATMLLALVFKAASGVFVNAFMQKMIAFNIVYAMYSLLPIPPLDGSKTFYGSRMLYAFSTAGLVAAAVMLTLNISILIAVVSSLLIAIVLWLLYYIFFE